MQKAVQDKLRDLNFFDRHSVKEEGSTSDAHPGLQNLDISAVCGGQNFLWIAEKNGTIHSVDKAFHTTAFRAFEGEVVCMKEVDSKLIAVGTDDIARIKIFRIPGPNASQLELLQQMKAWTDRPEGKVLFFDVASDMSYMVMGLDSRVFVHRKMKDSGNKKMKDAKRLTGEVLTYEGGIFQGMPIGVRILESDNRTVLFVVSERQILSFALHDNDRLLFSERLKAGEPCNEACCIFPVLGTLLVSRAEAVFSYDPIQGNVSSGIPLPGVKNSLTPSRKGFFTTSSIDPKGQGRDRVTVVLAYPQVVAVIAYQGQFTDVAHVVTGFGNSIVVICKNRRDDTNAIFELKEKSVGKQITMLQNKRMFELAAEIATRENLPKEDIANIYSLHGDLLYEKRAFDQALAVYMKTIDLELPLETSFVIEKFLEAQKVGHIAEFLRRLHEKHMATSDHTALLLKCYTKLKDDRNLEEFISTIQFSDAAIALEVLEETGYASLAAHLAHQHKLYDDYVRIQLSRREDVMTFIKQLPPEDAVPLLKTHGRRLLKRCPEQTMRVIEELIQTKTHVCVDDFVQLCIDDASLLERLLRFCIKVLPTHPNNEDPRVPNGWVDRVLVPTLLEILLRAHEQRVSDKNARAVDVQASAAEIMALLQKFSRPLVLEAVLVTTRMYKFHQGYAFVCEKLEKFQLLFAQCLEQNDGRAIVDVCKRCGPKEPSLWVQGLPYVANCGSREELGQILSSVAMGDLMSPLAVIEALDENPNVTWGDVQPYLEAQFRHLSAPVAEAKRQIAADKAEIEKMKQEIKQLQTKPRIFDASKCYECNNALEPPSIHFFCLHSFCADCVPPERECPVCAAEARPRLELLSQRRQIAPEEFFKYLRGSKGGFDTICEYFGRGVL
eukprot:GEMP01004087.1.p1 GENE.GEMP01004087.1~~GEMP01004087.1.p1  ORF type:complete len:914 (+),score=208.06 GEMP01004087.1:66-2744(+)